MDYTDRILKEIIKKYPRAARGITHATAKYVLLRVFQTGKDPVDICEEENLWQIT